MLTQNQLDKIWPQFREGIKNLWGGLSNQEIDEYKADISEISSLIHRKYGESKDDIRLELNKLIDSFDNDTDKGLDPDSSSYHRSPLTNADNIVKPSQL